VPGTLLDCTPDFASYHQIDQSELWADYAYFPRFGPESDTGLPPEEEARLITAYLGNRAKGFDYRIMHVVRDAEYTYRVALSNRTGYPLDEPGPTWHTEEWGIHADGEWHGIPKNPHPPYEHMVGFCANCGY
jgi:hypothetical protein